MSFVLYKNKNIKHKSYQVTMENKSWLHETMTSMNNKLSELIAITSSHSMALKILGAGLTIVATILGALIIRCLGGKVL
jgi:gamma-glutamyl-gamma-aminobutyrate hydrolase PuuD